MKNFVKAIFLSLCLISPVLADSPAAIQNVASVAQLLLLKPVGQYTTVNLQSYYAGLGKGGGLLNWNSTSTTTPDNCVTFRPTAGGTGRWIRQNTTTLDITMCGAYADNSHDDAAAITATFTAAALTPTKNMTIPGGYIKVSSSITMAEGVSVHGAGYGPAADLTQCGTVINGATVVSGWIFNITTPNGTTQFNAPKLYDMCIQAPFNSGVGGCVRWNSLSGGFTNDGTSQYYMVKPIADKVACAMWADATVTQIGFQCNKCFDGSLSHIDTMFGLMGVDIEGSDRITVGQDSRFQGSYGSLVKFKKQGAQHFGNMDVLENSHILYPYDLGQALSSFVELSGSSDVMRDNHVEGNVTNGVAVIEVNDGFSKTIEGNDIDGFLISTPIPCWLKITGAVTNITAINNGVAGNLMGTACFSVGGVSGTTYYYNSAVRQIITHMGNANNGDTSWPANTVTATDSLQLALNSQQYYSPSTGGLGSAGASLNAWINSGYFDLNVSGLGSGNYLDFGPSVRPQSLGALTVYCLASGAGTLNGAVTDAGVVISYASAALTARPKWLSLGTGTATTNAGARIYADAGATNAHIYACTLGQ